MGKMSLIEATHNLLDSERELYLVCKKISDNQDIPLDIRDEAKEACKNIQSFAENEKKKIYNLKRSIL